MDMLPTIPWIERNSGNEDIFRVLVIKRAEIEKLSSFAYMGKRSNPQKEIVVDGYKTDIYLPGEDTIIEVKSIISLDKQAIFPTVYSERAINQLKKIRELLQGGKKVTYLFVSLNPYVESFAISNEKQMDEFRDLFLDCLESGMECKGYTTCLNNYEIQIKKEIPFIISIS